jgi:CBS domain-containing protein
LLRGGKHQSVWPTVANDGSIRTTIRKGNSISKKDAASASCDGPMNDLAQIWCHSDVLYHIKLNQVIAPFPLQQDAAEVKQAGMKLQLMPGHDEHMEASRETNTGMYGFLACTVAQFMTRSVVTVARQTTMHELGALFEKHDFNAFPVAEDDKMLGIVSKFDFLRVFAFTSSQMVPHYDELMSRSVADVMTEAVVHVGPTSPLTRVLELMVSVKARSFPVLDPDRQLQGIISREDIMRALKETTQQEGSK